MDPRDPRARSSSRPPALAAGRRDGRAARRAARRRRHGRIEAAPRIDESLLTGESLPVDKTEGSPVYAGTLNFHGALVVRVARAGADTALARIARAVEDAQASKAPIARLADRVSAWFVPSVLAIAAVTLVAWWSSGAGTTAPIALERMIAVLVVACPCALGLATPAAVAVGTSRGAELGVLFGGGAALELASRIDVVCLDKTGTLTAGHPVLADGIPDELLRVVASVEQASEHPIARAIVDGARRRGLVLERPTEVAVEPGAGISARVGGQLVRVGTRAYVGATGELGTGAISASVLVRRHRRQPMRGYGRGQQITPAPDARAAIATLRAMGIEPVMVTSWVIARRPRVAIARRRSASRKDPRRRPADGEGGDRRAASCSGGRTTSRWSATASDDAPALAAADPRRRDPAPAAPISRLCAAADVHAVPRWHRRAAGRARPRARHAAHDPRQPRRRVRVQRHLHPDRRRRPRVADARRRRDVVCRACRCCSSSRCGLRWSPRSAPSK